MTVKELLIKIFTRSDSSGAKDAGKAIQDVKDKTTRADNAGKGFFSRMTSGLGKIPALAGLAAGGIIGIAVALARLVKEAVVFNVQMARAWTMWQGGGFRAIRTEVIGLADDLGIAKSQLAGGLYQALSKSVPQDNVISFLRTAAKAAIADGSQVITAVDGITNVLNAFHIEAERAEEVADALFATVANGGTTFQELASNIAVVAPVASSANIAIVEVLASIATLTKGGTPTAQAVTQIRSAIIGLNKALGDGWSKTMSLQEAMLKVEEQAGGSQVQLQKLLGTVEGVMGVLGMTGKNAQQAAADLDDMRQSAGSLDSAFGKMDHVRHWSKLWQNLKTTLLGVALIIDKILWPAVIALTWALKAMNTGFQWFTGNLPKAKNEAEDLANRVKGKLNPALQDAARDAGRAAGSLDEIAQADMSAVTGQAGDVASDLGGIATAADDARGRLASLQAALLGIKTSEIDLAVARGEMTKEQGDLAKIAATRSAGSSASAEQEKTLRQQIADAKTKAAGAERGQGVAIDRNVWQASARDRAEMEAQVPNVKGTTSEAAKQFYRKLDVLQLAEEEARKRYKESADAAKKIAEANTRIAEEKEKELELLLLQRRQSETEYNAQEQTVRNTIREKEESAKAADHRKKLEAELAEAEARKKKIESLTTKDVPEFGAAAKEARETREARAAIDTFKATTRYSERSLTYKQTVANLQREADKQASELDQATDALGKAFARHNDLIAKLTQKIQNVERQLENRDET